ncbi:hypothetical protein NESM_000769200 [Novymonas esmeraldas]|uniref:Swiss Army Knife RNA repair protein HAD domain-containing protein n=1 Tax=Novymonas esmeraldas TaxID=1808958 RepID=A0AAW0EVK3_9TRYP
MVELHIFDFDGTIFYSPAADADALADVLAEVNVAADGGGGGGDAAAEAKKLHGRLRNPVSSGGLGWYQSLATLSPPAVPEHPSEERWFVTPILAHMRAIVAARSALVKQRRPTVGAGQAATRPAAEMPLLYVLTGRDSKYADRIWTLLQQAGLDKEVEDVLLKGGETAGTVKYKLNRFFSLIQRHHPTRVFYYEDRVEQGARLLEGMRALEEMLFSNASDAATHRAGGAAAADRVGVVTFDVDVAAVADGALAQGGNGVEESPPMVVPYASGSHADEAAAHLSVLERTLRSSPHALLRDACYPVDRRATFYTPAASDTAMAAAAMMDKAQRQAERQAQEWVADTVRYYNSRGSFADRGRGGRGGRPETGGGRGRGSAAHIESAYDASALRRTVSFAIPPPFVFLMVLVPQALCRRCSRMLSTEKLAALLRTLELEQRAAVGGGR